MEVIINHPYTEPGQGHLPRNFLPSNFVNLPSRKSPGISVFTNNQQISHPCSRPTRFQTLTTDVTVGFNQRKPPDRTVCVAVDLSAASDTVCHNNLLSKINRSQLPPATAQWLFCYLRGRQAKTCFRGVKSTSRKVCCCLPTPMTLASGGSPMFPHVVHQPASPSIWPAVQSLRRGLSTNPGVIMWCVCGCS